MGEKDECLQTPMQLCDRIETWGRRNCCLLCDVWVVMEASAQQTEWGAEGARIPSSMRSDLMEG
jgi:hypothetical protein